MITTNCEPTATQKDAYKLASEELLPIIDSLRIIVDIDITNLKSEIQKIGGPWVPGTIPNFKPE
jgi:hypothetical protein